MSQTPLSDDENIALNTVLFLISDLLKSYVDHLDTVNSQVNTLVEVSTQPPRLVGQLEAQLVEVSHQLERILFLVKYGNKAYAESKLVSLVIRGLEKTIAAARKKPGSSDFQ